MPLPLFSVPRRGFGFAMGAQIAPCRSYFLFLSNGGIDLRIRASVNSLARAVGALSGHDTRWETLLDSVVQLV